MRGPGYFEPKRPIHSREPIEPERLIRSREPIEMIELVYIKHKPRPSTEAKRVHIHLPRVALTAASARFRRVDYTHHGNLWSIPSFTGQEQMDLERLFYQADLHPVILHFADWLETGKTPLFNAVCSWDFWIFGYIMNAPMYQDTIICTMLKEASRSENPADVILGSEKILSYVRHCWRISGYALDKGPEPSYFTQSWTDKHFLKLLLDTLVWLGPYKSCVEEIIHAGGLMAVFVSKSLVNVVREGIENEIPWGGRHVWKYLVESQEEEEEVRRESGRAEEDSRRRGNERAREDGRERRRR